MSATTTPRTRVRRLGSALVNLLMVAAIIGGLAYIVPSFLGYDRYVITSGSMTGTYDVGSVVFEQRVPVSSLRVGDVVTYNPPASSGIHHLVTHRIVSAAPAPDGRRTFRTKGDANPSVDPWTFTLTAPTQPVARYSLPKVGWLMIAMANRQTRMLVVGVPAALVALASLVQLVQASRAAARRPGSGRTPVATA